MSITTKNTPSTATPEHARRLAMKQMAVLLGISLTTQSLDVLAATKSKPQDKPIFLTAEQLALTAIVVEHIIPTTDTPGAQAAGVHLFIDHYLPSCCTKAEQAQYLSGLAQLNTVAKNQFKKVFARCTHQQQIELLTQLDAGQAPFSAQDKTSFTLIKTLTLFGYYTSEIGATHELAYLAIPGGYKGDFPFSTLGKAWSLN